MKVEIAIAGVDGETNLLMETSAPQSALNFLRAYDHEGSGVSVSITDDNEGAYRLLEAASNLHQQEQNTHGDE